MGEIALFFLLQYKILDLLENIVGKLENAVPKINWFFAKGWV